MARTLELHDSGGLILIGAREAFPAPFAKYNAPVATPALLIRIAANRTLKAQLVAGWWRLDLPRELRMIREDQVLLTLEKLLASRRLMMMWAPSESAHAAPREPVGTREKPFGQWTAGEKLAELMHLAVGKVQGELQDHLRQLINPVNVATSVGMMLALAASHAVGIGVAVDAVLVTYAYISAGLAGITAIGDMIRVLLRAINAKKREDLEPLAKLLAAALVVLGLAFLKRFLRRIKERPVGGGSSGQANAVGSKGRTTAAPQGNVPAQRTGALHNSDRPALEVQRGSVNTRPGKPGLTEADKKAYRALRDQGYPAGKALEVARSAKPGTAKPITLKEGDTLYGFGTAGRAVKDKTDSAYWMTEKQYQDVRGRFRDPRTGEWDRNGVKDYLALPCYNKVDTFVSGTVGKTHNGLSSTIGEATETVVGRGANALPGRHTLMGGGGQTTPAPGTMTDIKEGRAP